MVNQRTLTHAHQEALHSSLFVSYLYNYFKISTDFGFPFREKSIKPCPPGMSGWVSYLHTFTVVVVVVGKTNTSCLFFPIYCPLALPIVITGAACLRFCRSK